MKPPIDPLQVSRKAERIFHREGLHLTLGGEPTFVAGKHDTPEWNYAATGPEKLRYARRLAALVRRDLMPEARTFFCPGKLYPGEVNPRWTIRLIDQLDGSGIVPCRSGGEEKFRLSAMRRAVVKQLGVKDHWLRFADPNASSHEIWALALDCSEDGKWNASAWPLAPAKRKLSLAEGPAGLRLPMETLPPDVARRALVLESSPEGLAVFLPAVIKRPFLELLAVLEQAGPAEVDWQAYLPTDTDHDWRILGLAADPGVLEINLPPCASWESYAKWTDELYRLAEECGLQARKQILTEPDRGSGGGSHLFFGVSDRSPRSLFESPHWIARLIRYWQRHPSLAYFFTGQFVGPASQAPRSDESGHSLLDLELALAHLEATPEKSDQRALIAGSLKHLMTDAGGNNHRAEISLDKFWCPGLPNGCLGVLEFRAIEALPEPFMARQISLLWLCCGAMLMRRRRSAPLIDHGTSLRDLFLLPTPLMLDLWEVLYDLERAGFPIPPDAFSTIMDWQFPVLLAWSDGEAVLEVRLAHEPWPLLCDTPPDGGTTSRFVDTSLRRLEIKANRAFHQSFQVAVNGRKLKLRSLIKDVWLAGLRYRHSRLEPSLHPAIPSQLPLQLSIHSKPDGELVSAFRMSRLDKGFMPSKAAIVSDPAPIRAVFAGAFTSDLRL